MSKSTSTPYKIWSLLTKEERSRVFILMPLMLIGMLLETLGIGLVIPAVSLMTQDDLISQYPQITPYLQYLGSPSQNTLVIIGMFFMVAVYAIKVGYITALLVWQQRFIYGARASLSQRLYKGYIYSPYTFHMQRNSAQLIRNVVNETSVYAKSGLNAGMMLVTEVLVLIGVVGLLLAFEPVGGLIVIVTFGVAGVSFQLLTKKRILLWGKARLHHEGLRIQHLQQGLGGVKDVKLLGREDEFLKDYWAHNLGSAQVAKYQAVIQQLPRLFLEFLAVLGLAVLVLSILWQGKPLDTLLQTLGLFAAAAFRVIPSANRILSAVQGLRYVLPVLDMLNDELQLLKGCENKNKQNSQAVRHKFQDKISLESVCFQYPSSDRLSLDSISLSIPFGSSVGFVGGSGAGKSTLVNVILGLLSPSEGNVKVDDISISKSLRDWQDQIGYVPQSIFLTDDSLKRNIALGLPSEEISEKKVWKALKAAQLEEFVRALPEGLDTQMGENGVRLSGGQKQRIGIARALYHQPRVLVLDEATSALDLVSEKDVMEAVCALKGETTLLIIAHRLSTIESCDQLFKIEDGKLVDQGEFSEVLGASKVGN